MYSARVFPDFFFLQNTRYHTMFPAGRLPIMRASAALLDRVLVSHPEHVESLLSLGHDMANMPSHTRDMT